MDNASTHMRPKVRELINGVGAYLLYTAPYSPDLNPIELGFGIYKKNLKRDHELQLVDWFQAHLNAIEAVNRDICIKEFRKCGVPCSDELMTKEEEEEKRCREMAVLFLSFHNFNNMMMNMMMIE